MEFIFKGVLVIMLLVFLYQLVMAIKEIEALGKGE